MVYITQVYCTILFSLKLSYIAFITINFSRICGFKLRFRFLTSWWLLGPKAAAQGMFMNNFNIFINILQTNFKSKNLIKVSQKANEVR